MSFFDREITVESLPENSSTDPVPAGSYDVLIHTAEEKSTKSGGSMLSLRLDIVGPSHQGRVVFANITLKNANPKAEEIGLAQLRALLQAAGLERVRSPSDLNGRRVTAKVTIRKSEEYGDQNEVKSFSATPGAAVPSFGNAAPKAPATPAASSSAPPWAK